MAEEKTARDLLREAYAPKQDKPGTKPDIDPETDTDTETDDNRTEDSPELASPFLYLRKGYEQHGED